MKKLLFIFTLICAFTINANAQDKKMNYQELAKKDVVDVMKLFKLDEAKTTSLMNVLEMKYQSQTDVTLSNERKAILKENIEASIRKTLSADQMAILEKNKELYLRMIN